MGSNEAGGVRVAGQGVGEAVTLCAGAQENVESINAKIAASVGRDGFVFFMGGRNSTAFLYCDPNSIATFTRP